MNEQFSDEYITMRKLSDIAINTNFIEVLDDKLSITPDNKELLLTRANICRRTGRLWEARDSFNHLLHLDNSDAHLRLSENNVTPFGFITSENMTMAPIMIFDDFLEQPDLDELLDYAQQNQEQFANAHTNSKENIYDPEKRKTLVYRHFTKERDRFEAFAKNNIEALCDGLGLPKFEISKIELKITNHVDGSFFQTHCDNHNMFEQAGRAITWLFYFGENPPRYNGGELYVFDTDQKSQLYNVQSFSKVIPKQNRIVAFPSHFRHAVAPMELPGNKFSDGRFAISSHISKKADVGF